MEENIKPDEIVFMYGVEDYEGNQTTIIAQNFRIAGEYVLFTYLGKNVALFKLPLTITPYTPYDATVKGSL